MKLKVKRHKVVQPKNKLIKLIPLTRGLNVIVDAIDYEFLIQWNWFALKMYWNHGFHFYAARASGKILMHRVLTNNKGVSTDHRDRNTLNNRRKNLRPCTDSCNAANQPKHRDNTSGYKGVHFYKPRKKWVAYIKVNYCRMHLGYFDNLKDAARAYDMAALKNFGKFAYTNF